MQIEIAARTPDSGVRRTVGIATFLLCLALTPPAASGETDSKIPPTGLTPLALLLGHIHGKIPGNVLKVELERIEHAGQRHWVYELKLLTPDGDVLKLRYDAKSLRLLQKRGHGRYGDGDDRNDNVRGTAIEHSED